MRDEWTNGSMIAAAAEPTPVVPRSEPLPRSRPASSQGLTRRQSELPSLSMAMSLDRNVKRKIMGKKSMQMTSREVSERRQVGDAESLVNPQGGAGEPWWRHVGMDEGL
jgi:hypothetical protein